MATVGSKEIGLGLSDQFGWTVHGEDIFGTAIISADFQMGGLNPPLPRIEALKIAASGSQIRGKIAQEPVLERAVRPRSFKDVYASKAICNLHGINDVFGGQKHLGSKNAHRFWTF